MQDQAFTGPAPLGVALGDGWRLQYKPDRQHLVARQCCGPATRTRVPTKQVSMRSASSRLNTRLKVSCESWSPEQIADKLPRMNSAATPALDPTVGALPSISHETINCALYAMPRTTLRSELLGLLRKGHKTRLPRARGTDRKGGIPNMSSICMHPPEVAARIVPGPPAADARHDHPRRHGSAGSCTLRSR